ncbi:MAG: hypothetical protein ACJ798_15250 [Phenylobacterium sp.]
MNAADPRSQPLLELSLCAYRLGKAFGAEAERAIGNPEWLKWNDLFERSFFAARMGFALEHRLRRAPAEPREPVSDREQLIDRPETEREERDRGPDERERERDRETERASFPLLVRTLDGVAAEAATLPGEEPRDLVNLRELLAHVKSSPAAPLPPRKPTANLRARLATSAGAVSALALPPRPPPSPAAGPLAGLLAGRRPTGPPRR